MAMAMAMTIIIKLLLCSLPIWTFGHCSGVFLLDSGASDLVNPQQLHKTYIMDVALYREQECKPAVSQGVPDESGTGINAKGDTPLKSACLYDRFEVIQSLVENATKVHTEGSGWKLCLACDVGHLFLVKLLILRLAPTISIPST